MQKISTKTYQKTVQNSKVMQQLDKAFQTTILKASADQYSFYLDLLKLLEADFKKASNELCTETISIIQDFKQNYAKAKRTVAQKVEIKVQKAETPNLENMLNELPINSQ